MFHDSMDMEVIELVTIGEYSDGCTLLLPRKFLHSMGKEVIATATIAKYENDYIQ